jgi:hypothetical protein
MEISSGSLTLHSLPVQWAGGSTSRILLRSPLTRLRDSRQVRILAARPIGSSRGGVDRWHSPSLAFELCL